LAVFSTPVVGGVCALAHLTRDRRNDTASFADGVVLVSLTRGVSRERLVRVVRPRDHRIVPGFSPTPAATFRSRSARRRTQAQLWVMSAIPVQFP